MLQPKAKREIPMKVLVTKDEKRILKILGAIEGKNIQGLFNKELERLLKKAKEMGIE